MGLPWRGRPHRALACRGAARVALLNMSIIVTLLGILGLSILGLCVWQHHRYLKARREIVQDQQPVLHPSRMFHAVIYLKVERGADVIEAVRSLRPVLESPGGGTIVYAGRAAVALVRSEQVENDWDAALLVQYDSRQAFDAVESGRSSGRRSQVSNRSISMDSSDRCSPI